MSDWFAGHGKASRRDTSPALTSAIALTALVLSACRTVGVHEPALTPGGSRPLDIALDDSASQPRPLGPETAAPLPDFEVDGIDEILHSPASVDTALREAASAWRSRWTGQLSETFAQYLERMGRYDQLVQRELDERDLPASLRYLPLVESGYSPRAVSRAGATGLWQLMRPTARELGLMVNSIVDDRRDPVASTAAALDYPEELHAEFGSWLLALAAYNGGPGRIRRVLDRYGPSTAPFDDERFIAVRRYLPRETREFIPRFFAAAALAEDPEKYGFRMREPDPMAFDEIRVPDATSLDVIATAAQVPEERIRRLNPHYLRGYTPVGEPRIVRVPVGLSATFERNFAAIPPEDRLSFLEHVVAAGETFSHIARRYGVAVSELTDANRQVEPRRLQIGMGVIVPLASSSRRSERLDGDGQP